MKRPKKAGRGRGLTLVSVVLAAALVVTGCQYDSHAGTSEQGSFWNRVDDIAETTWFLDQTRAAIDRGDFNAARVELREAQKRAARIGAPSDSPSDEFFEEASAIIGPLVESTKRDLAARNTKNLPGIEAETTLRRQLNRKYLKLMSNTDFSDFTMNEPDRQEVENSMWRTHGFLDCIRMNKLAENPNVFERCNDEYSYPSPVYGGS